MNILLLTSGINKKFNDNYHSYAHIAALGNNIIAITQRENINKGGRTELSSKLEIDGRLKIYRLFDTLSQQYSLLGRASKYSIIKKILFDFKPDVILCEELSNIRFAIEIKRYCKIPIVLRVEFAYDKDHPYRTMGRSLKYFKNSLTGDFFPILIGRYIWDWACKHSDAVISCYFGDTLKINAIENKMLNYVPWPTFESKPLSSCIRLEKRAVYIGSFDRHKNLKEFASTIPMLLQNTPIKEFCIVGTGEDLYVIDKLKVAYPDNIRHIISLSRDECLDLIRSSYFSYSPAIRGGWAFVGDSWAMKTPVIVTHNHYNFKDGDDTIVTTPSQIVDRVNELYNDYQLLNKITTGGYDRFISNHTAKAVGQKFYDICATVVK